MGEPRSTRVMVGDDRQARRRTIRYVAAAASAVTAILYFAIGVGVLRVVDEVSADAPSMLAFGAPAGAAFLLGAVLLVAVDRRILWVLGAILQVLVIVMYIAVSAQRTPPFETWGILIKILQAAILAALLYLILDSPARDVSPTSNDESGIPRPTKRD